MDGCPAVDDATLLLYEIVANAIAHSASGGPGDTFIVRVSHVPGDHVRAEVQDAGSDWHGDITGRPVIRTACTCCSP